MVRREGKENEQLSTEICLEIETWGPPEIRNPEQSEDPESKCVARDLDLES